MENFEKQNYNENLDIKFGNLETEIQNNIKEKGEYFMLAERIPYLMEENPEESNNFLKTIKDIYESLGYVVPEKETNL